MRRVIVETEEGTRHEYSVSRCCARQRAGRRACARRRSAPQSFDRGPIDPHYVLAILGIKELQKYLVDKIQEVYRSQSVAINDKHIEVICRQMLRSVRVTRVETPTFWSTNRSIASASWKRTKRS
jgi:DNA-directed RNA polymerase subunit beta'